MFNRKEILDSIAVEHHIIKHLHSKLTAENLDYKPNEHQRSLKELLEYMSRMTFTMTAMLETKGSMWEKGKELKEASESKDMINDFVSIMDEQYAYVTAYLEGASDETLNEVVDLFGMWNPLPIKTYFMNILFKNYPAYRMQLFHYMKNGLWMSDLNTMNLWVWMDWSM